MKYFKEKVLEVVKNIPKGSVMTYKEIAIAVGSPKAYRGVGTLMKNNYDESIPCHRVIRSDGKIGEYNRGGEKEKIRKLKEEGCDILFK